MAYCEMLGVGRKVAFRRRRDRGNVLTAHCLTPVLTKTATWLIIILAATGDGRAPPTAIRSWHSQEHYRVGRRVHERDQNLKALMLSRKEQMDPAI